MTAACATHGLGDDALHGPREGSSHAKATVVQNVHGHLEAAAHLTQDALGGHAHVVEVYLSGVGGLDAHLLLRRAAAVRERGQG